MNALAKLSRQRFEGLAPRARNRDVGPLLMQSLGNSAANATLPASWAGLRQLAVLDLTGAGVAGGLPEDWAHMSGLRTLLLGGNSLNGTLPATWAALDGLTTL